MARPAKYNIYERAMYDYASWSCLYHSLFVRSEKRREREKPSSMGYERDAGSDNYTPIIQAGELR